MKLPIHKVREGLMQLSEDYSASRAFSTAEDYRFMAETLKLIESERPELIAKVERIWEGA